MVHWRGSLQIVGIGADTDKKCIVSMARELALVLWLANGCAVVPEVVCYVADASAWSIEQAMVKRRHHIGSKFHDSDRNPHQASMPTKPLVLLMPTVTNRTITQDTVNG